MGIFHTQPHKNSEASSSKESTDPIFVAMIGLNLLRKRSKNKEASNNFRVGFALSKRPHLHRAYLVTFREYLSQAVLYAQTDKDVLFWFWFWEWTPSIGRKVGIPRGILPHVQTGLTNWKSR